MQRLETLYSVSSNIHSIATALRRTVCFIVCLILFAALFPIPAKAAEQSEKEAIRVGWYECAYQITRANGERSGYAYEYEQTVSTYTGWNYEYVTGDWTELMDMLQRGDIDIMANVSYTDERAETILFSDRPMGEEKYYLYVDITNADISLTNLSNLNGKRIAMIENSVQTEQFCEWEKEHNITTEHVLVDTIEETKELFDNDEIDGIISTENSIWVERGLSPVVITGSSDIYFGISKARPDLKEALDAAMRSMEYDKPFYNDELYKQYIATETVVFLTEKEKEWLKEHGEIRLGFLKDDTGFSTYDRDNGELLGVINDYVQDASDCFGGDKIKFRLIGFDLEENQIEALQEGKIDMIFHAGQNPYMAEQNGISLSDTVLSTPLAVLTKQSHFDENAENRVAISKEDLQYKWYISYNYPDWKIVECNSAEDAESKVRNGEADCFPIRIGVLMQYVDDKNIHGVFLTRAMNSSFAVGKGNITLLSILNKTLKTMETSKLSSAESAYEDSLRKVTAKEFIKDNFLIFSLVILTVFIVVLVIILGLLRKARIAEEKAKNAQQQAEQANSAKSTFLFNMSHDIRTPMNALLGYNQLMKKQLTDLKLLDYQQKIEQAGKLLLDIINNVLDLARIESGKMYLNESYAQVDQLLEEVVSVFEPQTKEKKINLKSEVCVQHSHVMCDITKIKQIFVNLISNAVKYTPSGGTIEIKLQEIPCEREGFAAFRTEIRDNGIGMSKDFLPTLFDSFSRERNTTTSKVAGTGLGMAIVKDFVDLMDGTIEVQSELAKGTTFIVHLMHRKADEQYYRQTDEGVESDETENILQGKHILMAEDNELNAEIASTILEEMGLQIDWVNDGVQCVSKVKQMPAGTYDLILMDIQMPNMDGYKATEIIRKMSDKEKAEIPIIAMTANAFEEDRRKAIVIGMNEHITKPIDAEKMKKIITEVLK